MEVEGEDGKEWRIWRSYAERIKREIFEAEISVSQWCYAVKNIRCDVTKIKLNHRYTVVPTSSTADLDFGELDLLENL